MAHPRFKVLGIKVQKDRYSWMRKPDPDREPAAGWSTEFLESAAGEADVIHFKRFKVRASIIDGGGATEFEMLLDTRGDTVTILAKGCRYGSDEIASALNRLLTPFYPGAEFAVLMTTGVGDGKELTVCAVRNAVRLAGVLHVFLDKEAELRNHPPREAMTRQQRMERARELAEKVYIPLRTELAQASIRSRPSAPDLYEWAQLRQEWFHLTSEIPPDLASELADLTALSAEVHAKRERARRLAAVRIEELAESLRQKAGRAGARATELRLWIESGGGGEIDLVTLWASDWTLKRYVDAQTARQPGSPWTLKVLAGGFDIGNADDANAIADQVFAIFANDQSMVELRAKTLAVIQWSERLLERVEEELRKGGQ